MKCNCNDKCYDLYADIDDDDNQYFIERLENIIEICEFLIQIIEHKRIKKETCDTMLKDLKKENEKKKEKNLDSKDKKVSEYDEEEIIRLLKYLARRKGYDTSAYPYTKKNPNPMPMDWRIWF